MTSLGLYSCKVSKEERLTADTEMIQREEWIRSKIEPKEIQLMKDKVKQLETEAQTINWYISVMERGKDAHNVLREYKAEIRDLESKL